MTFGHDKRIFDKSTGLMEQKTITAAAKGDTKAFEMIVREYSRLIFRISGRILGNACEAEDIVQQTFIRAWISLSGYDSRYSFSTWIGSIACRLCYDTLRKRNRHSAYGNEILRSASGITAEDPEKEMIAKELGTRFRMVTRTLSPMQKTVFVLHEIEQLPGEEIRKITGWSPIQIKSNLYAARKKVRKALTEMEL